MKNFKIGTRIMAGFAAMIMITITLGLFAYTRMQNIEASKVDMAENSLPSIVLLSGIAGRANHQLVLMTQHINTNNPQEQARLEAEIAEIDAVNNKNVALYEALPAEADEKALTASMKSARAAKAAIFNECLRTSRLNTPESAKKARSILDEQLRPAQEKFTDSLQALVDLNVKGNQVSLMAITGAVASSKQGILIGIAFAIILAIPISMYIVRGIVGPIQQALAVLERVEQCDLTATLDIQTKDEMGQMATALNAALKRLRNTLKEVVSSAASASASSQELSAAAESIASGAQEQAASLEETSASLEEITATIRQSADNSKQANQLATGSRESAERGQDVVTSAVAAMAEINVASAKISDIISTIDEIAFQTNLLAVNAAVEAARAGEEGRGFAVVASEVRSLAQRSAGAAKEIKVLIQDTLKKVERGSELVNRSGETLLSIVGSVKRVTDIVGEISAAADEQSTGVDQVNTAVTQIDQVTQSNSAQTEELSSTAQTLSAQSLRLTKLVSIFTLDADQQDVVAAPVRARAHAPAVQTRVTVKKGLKKVASKVSARPSVLSVTPAVMASVGAGSDSSFEEF